MRTAALAHIPSKENQNNPQSIADPISPGHQSESLGIPGQATGAEEDSDSQASSNESLLEHPGSLTTDADCFGVYHVYSRKPLRDPIMILPNTRSDTQSLHPADPGAVCQPETSQTQGAPRTDMENSPYYHPFSNPSAAAMMIAHHSGTQVQSVQKTTQIARTLGSLGADLNHLDLINFDAALEHKKLDLYLASAPENVFHREDGWLESSVRIRLPLDKKKVPEPEAAQFEVEGVFHRDIVDVISSVYRSDAVQSFTHIPFKEFWKPSEGAPPERLYGEIFSSQAMLNADKEICRLCLENDLDNSDLEAVSVPLLLYSDSTHLANFGTASCWPVYLFFGSQSKYTRAMPTSSACHHIAYMPEVRRI